MELRQSEARITIARILELAYSENQELTVKILANSPNPKLTVKGNGKAALADRSQVVSFNALPALEKSRVPIRLISMDFEQIHGMQVSYAAIFNTEEQMLTVNGSFDLEVMMMFNSVAS